MHIYSFKWYIKQDNRIHGEIQKQEMSLKKANGVGLKKEKKYLYINLTQMTKKNDYIVLSRISGQLFWRTLLESKWCLQIPLRAFITCVMTDRGRKTCKSYLVHKAHAQVNIIK